MEKILMNSVLTSPTSLVCREATSATIQKSASSETVRLLDVQDTPVVLDFEGGSLTSDAGILLLREVEQQIGIIKALAGAIDDPRDARYVKHTIMDLRMQRVSQIASGYEDADDCDELRHDPVFKMFAGRLPESGAALASQPTMSRFENSLSRTYLFRLAYAFADNFVASYAAPPKVMVLDFDDTEDKVYGDQQLALFNNYFKDYCLMPLHVYEGLSGKLITTILKPGKRAKGKQMLAIVKRVIKYLRQHWPETLIVFRGDAHFSYPEVMEWLDGQDEIKYVLGLTGNARLTKLVQAHVDRATKLYEQTQNAICLYHSIYYQAGSWKAHKRVVAKIEVTAKGLNVRYVVTNMQQAKAQALYTQIYCARGNAELYIKEHKLYLKSDRTSCTDFRANQFRLFLHSAAYVLIHALKTNVLKHTPWANATIATLRLRLFKIGARVRQLKTRIKVELPSAFPLKTTVFRSFQIFELLLKT
jgi:hypothetical protein